jgi:hypothetical protein
MPDYGSGDHTGILANTLAVDSSGYVIEVDATTGTVTSVALSVPTGLTVTGSPITTNGTITIGGTLGVANGGTGATTLTGILVGNGTSAISSITSANDGYVLTADGVGGYAFEVASGGDVTVDGASVGNRVAVWNNTTGELRGTSAIATENSNIYLSQPSTNGTDKFNYIIGGAFAINENDFGIQNTGFGEGVFNSADFTGNANTAFGLRSQYGITTGASNTSVGFHSMYDNRSGSYNVGLGGKTMFNQRISNYNVAIGYDSMDGVTLSQTEISNYNTAVGYQSLQLIQGGDNNTVIGKDSGNAITTGSNNVIIGSNTGSTIATSSNNIIISDGGGNIRIQVNSDGNVGIGTSTIESYWSGYTVLKVGYNNSIFGNTADSVGSAVFISQNLYSDASNYRYVGSGSDEGGLIDLRGGAFVFSNAPLGTAGNVASIVPRFTITSGGNVGIGTNSPSSYDNESNDLVVASGVDGATPTTGITIACLGDTKATGRGALRFSDGTSSNEKYIGGVEYNHNGDSMSFRVGGTPKLTISSGGNVGIGTTPSNWKSTWKALNIGQSVGLFSQDNNTTGLSSNVIFDGTNWTNKNIGATAFYQQSEGAHYFYGNGSSTDAAGTIFSPTTHLTISSVGNVGIGTTPSAKLSVYTAAFGGNTAGSGGAIDLGVGSTKYWQFRLDTANSGDFKLDKTYSNVWSTPLSISRSSGAAAFSSPNTTANVAMVTIRSTDSQGANVGGTLGLGGSYGAGLVNYALIRGAKETSTNNDSNGYMSFTVHSSAGEAERMRISSGGDVGIGHNGYGGYRLSTRGVDSTSSNFALLAENSGTYGLFSVRNDGFITFSTLPNSPYSNGVAGRDLIINSAGQLGTSVSIREAKINIENESNVNWLYDLNPVKFNYRQRDENRNYLDKAEEEQRHGLIAEEVEEVNTDFCWYNVNEEGDKTLAGVDYKMLITPMLKAIQEQQKIIEDLKSRIETLEG